MCPCVCKGERFRLCLWPACCSFERLGRSTILNDLWHGNPLDEAFSPDFSASFDDGLGYLLSIVVSVRRCPDAPFLRLDPLAAGCQR
jgi:hypothetical protein